MNKLFLTQETVYKMYALLNECEDFLRDNNAHSELHTQVSDLLNEVDRERQSYSYLQPN